MGVDDQWCRGAGTHLADETKQELARIQVGGGDQRGLPRFMSIIRRSASQSSTGCWSECRVCAHDPRRVDPSPPGLAQSDTLFGPWYAPLRATRRHDVRPRGALGHHSALPRMA
jgi:hypothetical protein